MVRQLSVEPTRLVIAATRVAPLSVTIMETALAVVRVAEFCAPMVLLVNAAGKAV